MPRDPASSWQGLPPRQLAGHPDAPPHVLLSLSARYPSEVLGNASLAMLSLVAPAAWTSIVFRSKAVIARGLIEGHAPRCDGAAAAWFLVGCAERVLPLLEAHDPQDAQPRRLLEAATAWAQGESDASALPSLWVETSRLRPPRKALGRGPALWARWVFDALSRGAAGSISAAAGSTAQALALVAGARNSPAFDRAFGEELERQVLDLERLSPALRQAGNTP